MEHQVGGVVEAAQLPLDQLLHQGAAAALGQLDALTGVRGPINQGGGPRAAS